jgi:hypothetical protein
VLLRGRAAENGAFLATNLLKATAFYGFDEIASWLREMRFVLDAVGAKFASYEADELSKARALLQQGGRRGRRAPAGGRRLARGAAAAIWRALVRGVRRAALHQPLRAEPRLERQEFLEVASYPHGEAWVVVHSGSRALGAAVYGVVAEARRFLSGGSEVASGEMALFYQRAFDALNKFAKLNLVLCALAVLDATGHETGVAEMQAAMRASPLFAPAIARAAATDAATLALLSGVVHNGVACFMNDELRTALFVLKKGAIDIDARRDGQRRRAARGRRLRYVDAGRRALRGARGGHPRGRRAPRRRVRPGLRVARRALLGPRRRPRARDQPDREALDLRRRGRLPQGGRRRRQHRARPAR